MEQNPLQSASRHSASMFVGQLKNTAGTLQLITNGREVKEYLKTFRENALIEYLSLYQKTFRNIAFTNRDGTEERRVTLGIAIAPLTEGTRDEYSPELLAHPNEARFFWGRNWRNESSPALQIGLAVFNYLGDTFTTILLARKISHPITHLTLITRDIMKGEKKNFDFSNIQSRDEVGLLVKSFQEMLGYVRRHQGLTNGGDA